MVALAGAKAGMDGAFAWTGDERRRQAYAAARRHSRIVRLLRVALPALAVLSVAGLAAKPLMGGLFAAPATRAEVETFGLTGSRVTMEQPKLQGFKKDGKPYQLDAASAEQDVRRPFVVDLKKLDAKLGVSESGWVRLRTANGTYDNQKETLVLPDAVRVLTDDGYDALMESADVELKSGTVNAAGPVTVESPDGRMKADKLVIRDNGKEFIFTGRVRTTLIAERDRAKRGAKPNAGGQQP